jgi:hypothetical protein
MSAPGLLTIGVTPTEALSRRPRLFAALEAALPVSFCPRSAEEQGDLDALLVFGEEAELRAAGAGDDLPSLTLCAPEPVKGGSPTAVSLSTSSYLDRCLRGATLPDCYLADARRTGASIEAEPDGEILARADGQPIWVRAGRRQRALLAPSELAPEEALRERLCDTRSAALLPLLHFLRGLTTPLRWQAPPQRACFLFDDPNLHWPSYGFVKLEQLASHARRHGYHAALATVPLDTWFTHPAALRALAESGGTLSLAVHGNDHNGGELGRLEDEDEALATAAQALRRVRAFERRTGATVERVMVPPHEECSEATVRALLYSGFAAISMTRPFPWLALPPRTWLARPVGSDALVGWRPADFTAGLPLLIRHPIAQRSAAEIVLRAYLGQPLVLYGHHDDLLDGPDVLAEVAAEVNRLGPTNWCSLGEIAAGNYESRCAGGTLEVRMLTRMAEVEIPRELESLSITAPPSLEREDCRLLLDGRPARLDEARSVVPGSSVQIELRVEGTVDVDTVPAPRRRPLAIARRLGAEGRDRLVPLAARAR